MKRTSRLLIAALLVALPGIRPAYADIYSFKDDKGITHLTNVPTDSRYAVALHEPHQAEELTTPKAPQLSTRAARQHHYSPLVEKVAREHNVDPALLKAVITVESSFDPKAKSNKGAVGLMQIMPNIARRYGVTDRYNPVENVSAGASYLRDLLQRFDGDIPLALAAYNAGEEAVARNGNHIPRNRETPSYVLRVMEFYRRYQPELD